MSGGHFDYKQYHISDIVDKIQKVIDENDSDEINSYGDILGRHYPSDIINDFKEGILLLGIAEVYAQRIDWLLSGDDSEDGFRRRLRYDLVNLPQ